LYFPRGVYVIGGALQDTLGANAQIIIPTNLEESAPITLELIGEVAPTATWGTQANPTGDGYSIIKSTLTGGTGNACMMGGLSSSEPHPNNVMVNLRDIVFQNPADPTFTCLDFSCQYGNRLSHVLIFDSVAAQKHPINPTHSWSYGVKLPPTGRSSRIDCDGLNVVGFMNGVRLGELTSGRIIVQACIYGIEVPFAFHPSKLDILGVYGCQYGISCPPGTNTTALRVDLYSIQDDNLVYTPWQIVINDVYDPTNSLRGTCTWSKITANVGVAHTFIKDGGVNFIGTELW